MRQVLKNIINRDAFKGPVKQSFAPPGNIVCFVLAGGTPVVYFEGDPEQMGSAVTWEFVCVWTGDKWPDDFNYIGIARSPGDGGGPPLVFHLLGRRV